MTARGFAFDRAAEAQNWRCCYCGARLEPETATVDHVMPRSLGGSNKWDNKVIACRECNSTKGAALINGVLSASRMARLQSGLPLERIKFDALILRRFALAGPLPDQETAGQWRGVVRSLLDRLSCGLQAIEIAPPGAADMIGRHN